MSSVISSVLMSLMFDLLSLFSSIFFFALSNGLLVGTGFLFSASTLSSNFLSCLLAKSRPPSPNASANATDRPPSTNRNAMFTMLEAN